MTKDQSFEYCKGLVKHYKEKLTAAEIYNSKFYALLNEAHGYVGDVSYDYDLANNIHDLLTEFEISKGSPQIVEVTK